MEMDGDEIAITYIKDVTFNTNLPDAEILKMTTISLPQPGILKECAEGAQYFPEQCFYSALEGLFQRSSGRVNKRGSFLKTEFLSPNPLGTCLTV